MPTDSLTFDVSQNSFDNAVVLKSFTTPVLVLYIEAWSEPCSLMADSLAELAKEFGGKFVLAKVDVDEHPELRKLHAISSVPTLKVFVDGDVVGTREGQMAQDELRALLKSHGIFRESDELRLQARNKHISGNTVEAIQLLTSAVQQDPGNTRIAQDMVQVFLDINALDQAQDLFYKLPEKDRISDTGKALQGQITFSSLAKKTLGKKALQEKIGINPNDHDAHFDLAICNVAEHDYSQAMTHLFKIFENDAHYKDGAAREMIIKLTETIAQQHPQMAQTYRRKLGSAAH